MRKLVRFASAGGERLFLLEALGVVAFMRLGLSLSSYSKLQRLVAKRGATGAATISELRRTAWAVSAAARLVPKASCLTQALAGQYLLARFGKASRIHVGVGRDTGGEFKAHAWLVSGGKVVLGGAGRDLAAEFAHLAEIG